MGSKLGMAAQQATTVVVNGETVSASSAQNRAALAEFYILKLADGWFEVEKGCAEKVKIEDQAIVDDLNWLESHRLSFPVGGDGEATCDKIARDLIFRKIDLANVRPTAAIVRDMLAPAFLTYLGNMPEGWFNHLASTHFRGYYRKDDVTVESKDLANDAIFREIAALRPPQQRSNGRSQGDLQVVSAA